MGGGARPWNILIANERFGLQSCTALGRDATVRALMSAHFVATMPFSRETSVARARNNDNRPYGICMTGRFHCMALAYVMVSVDRCVLAFARRFQSMILLVGKLRALVPLSLVSLFYKY